MDASRTKVIACATIIGEMLPLLPPGIQTQSLDFGLHMKPERLRQSLQEAVNASAGEADTILLGYGLCSHAVIGLYSSSCTLVVPRVDDCIALFLGSRATYLRQARSEPGTYYLTKGWIEAGDTPFAENAVLVERHGREKVHRMGRLTLRNYTRLVFIRTGNGDLGPSRFFAHEQSRRFGLRYEELQGAPTLLLKMIQGPWDDEILVVPPGRTICYADFVREEVGGEGNVEGAH